MILNSFRGPAPLQRMIVSGANSAGVTLQTLDEKDFDHGIILAQTRQNELLPISKTCTYQELLEKIAPVAANMLVQGIRDKVYVPPYEDRGWYQNANPRRAPKVTAADREINWKLWSGAHINRSARGLGRLWNKVGVDPFTTKRFIFEDVEVVPLPEVIKGWFSFIEKNNTSGNYHYGIERQRLQSKIRFLNIKLEQEDDWAQPYVEDGDAVIFPTHRQMAIRVKEITVEGSGKQSARHVMSSINEDEEWELRRGKSFSFRLQLKGPRIRKLEQNANYFGPVRTEGWTKKEIKELSEKHDLVHD
jgi:methionyl-tRNA formyltransferase